MSAKAKAEASAGDEALLAKLQVLGPDGLLAKIAHTMRTENLRAESVGVVASAQPGKNVSKTNVGSFELSQIQHLALVGMFQEVTGVKEFTTIHFLHDTYGQGFSHFAFVDCGETDPKSFPSAPMSKNAKRKARLAKQRPKEARVQGFPFVNLTIEDLMIWATPTPHSGLEIHDRRVTAEEAAAKCYGPFVIWLFIVTGTCPNYFKWSCFLSLGRSAWECFAAIN